VVLDSFSSMHVSAVQLNDALNVPLSLIDGFGGYDGVGFPVRMCKASDPASCCTFELTHCCCMPHI
jgi:hypothetical protein